jgi:hypothetical protein
MLTLPSIINTRISGTVRHPVIAFELGFSTLIRVANHSITWDGKTFTKAGLEPSLFKTGKGGIQTGRIEFINEDFAFTSLIFAESTESISANGYIFYGDGPFNLGDEIHFFKGEIVRPVRVYDTVMFDIATIATAARQVPDFTPSPPDINHLPYPGQTFTWEGQPYEVLY